MDVDAIQTLTDEQKTQHMKDNACFYCHKIGHRANKCRKKLADQQGNSAGNPGRSNNAQIRTNESKSTAPDMTPSDISTFLKENMGTLDDDTKIAIANALMPSGFVEAQN